jgi:hypothetical protein
MAEFPEADLDGVTELRIHGVSGTPVTSMLQHPHPVQVSGDGLAGFYRRGAADDPESPERGKPRRLEAYSWGGLTAGASARAFWLLLLPFTLVNVASWAHPVRPRPRFTPVGAVSGLVRLLALTVTGTAVLGTSVITVDLLAWQCGGDAARCASRHFYTDFLSRGYWHEPGRRLVVGALAPVLLVAVLWWLSRSTGHAYEEYAENTGGTDATAEKPSTVSQGAADLAKPRFWSGGGPLRRLRSLHTGAALATVAALVAYAARQGDTGTRHTAGSWLVGVALGVVAVTAVLAFSPYSGRRRDLFEHRDPPAPARVLMELAQYAGAIVVVAALAYAWGRTGPAQPGIVPGLHHAVNRLLRAQLLLWGSLVIVTAWALLSSRETWTASLERRPMFFGFAGPAVAAIGVMVAGLYVSGAGFRFADLLGTPVPSTVLAGGGGVDPANAVLGVPPEYYWAGTGASVATVAAVVTVVVTLLMTRRAAKRKRAAVRLAYGVPSGDDDRVATIAKAEATAGLTDVGDVVLLGILGPALVGTLLLWAFQSHVDGHILSELTTTGTWLVDLSALGLVALGRLAYKNDSTRRTVGIIWDLATFWPRAAHPFAPPCYCERTVPELRRRIARLRGSGGTIVLSAHSQGTVIAAAAVLQIAGEDLPKVGLVTYGSPLDRLYARAFPHYFGATALADIRGLLGGRWRNLYRRTDPIGGPVFAADDPAAPPPTGPDLRFVDPTFAKDAFEFTWPRARAHSNYPHDPRFEETISAVATLVTPPVSGGAPPAPRAPRSGRGTRVT